MTNKNEDSLIFNVQDVSKTEALVDFAKALSSPDRIRILNLLDVRPMNLLEISKALNIPVSSVSFHIQHLEKARIVRVDYKPALKGHMKLCSIALIHANLDFTFSEKESEQQSVSIEQGVGSYCDCSIEEAYLVGAKDFLFRENNYRKKLFMPERFSGQLFSFITGSATYRFPNIYLTNEQCSKLSLSFEVCSEAPFYRTVWPSDITVWINGIEIATYTSPGDFGGRRGKFSPEFWLINSTQFGMLKEFSIDKNGTYLDSTPVSKEYVFSDLKLGEKDFIDVTIGIKPDALYQGGINIFGESFGDYPQGIVLTLCKPLE